MPPKAKITKEMLLNTVLDITRERGFEAVNARSVADRLRCSTRPIFTCCKSMEELKKEFLLFAYGYYERYVEQYDSAARVHPFLLLPLSYIAFAQEETHLFQLLFVSGMDLDMRSPGDFYRERGNERKARDFGEAAGVEPERAKAVFLDLFLYAHGMAVLTASKKMSLDRGQAEQMLTRVLGALMGQEKPDWDAPGRKTKP